MDKKIKEIKHILELFADCVEEIKIKLDSFDARFKRLENYDRTQDEVIAELCKEVRELKRLIDDGK